MNFLASDNVYHFAIRLPIAVTLLLLPAIFCSILSPPDGNIDTKALPKQEWGTEEIDKSRNEVEEMFRHAYDSYLQHAFPMDELRPISCTGVNTYGGIPMSLIESLDTLLLIRPREMVQVMGNATEFNRAIEWLRLNLSFDLDVRINVFEASIRALGSLLSAHVLIEQSNQAQKNETPIHPNLEGIELAPGYDGELLQHALDLGYRLLPAFTSKTRLPYAWVNLRHGLIPGDVRHTCTAGAGTLLLEFGLLSRLSGQPVFEENAKAAIIALYERRSDLGLLGNTIHCDTGNWIHRDSGAGPGIDSFYEYLLKSYLLLGDSQLLSMFTTTYTAAMQHLWAPSEPRVPWLLDVNMDTGRLSRPWISSLQAFWPGMQVLVGDLQLAVPLHEKFWTVWQKFSFLPELFNLLATQVHPLEKGYPLRPEMAESTYLLYKATGDTKYLDVGQDMVRSLQQYAMTECGFASIGDVSTQRLSDHMESFFLSETLKYLYLLFAPHVDVAERYVFSTEGHLYPLSLSSSFHTTCTSSGKNTTCIITSQGSSRSLPIGVDDEKENILILGEDTGKVKGNRESVQSEDVSRNPDIDSGSRREENLEDEGSGSNVRKESLNKIESISTQQQDSNLKISNREEVGDEKESVGLEGVEGGDEKESVQMENAEVGDEKETVGMKEVLGVESPFFQDKLPILGSLVDQILHRRRVSVQKAIALIRISEHKKADGVEEVDRERERDLINDVRLVVNSETAPLRKALIPGQVLGTLSRPAGSGQIVCIFTIDQEGYGTCKGWTIGVPIEASDHQRKARVQFLLEGTDEPHWRGCGVRIGSSTEEHPAGHALFGPSLSEGLLLVGGGREAVPLDACTPIENREEVVNRIAVVERGGCSFTSKALTVQAAGAIGMVVINTAEENTVLVMGPDVNSVQVKIPSLLITHQAGIIIKDLFRKHFDFNKISVPEITGDIVDERISRPGEMGGEREVEGKSEKTTEGGSDIDPGGGDLETATVEENCRRGEGEEENTLSQNTKVPLEASEDAKGHIISGCDKEGGDEVEKKEEGDGSAGEEVEDGGKKNEGGDGRDIKGVENDLEEGSDEEVHLTMLCPKERAGGKQADGRQLVELVLSLAVDSPLQMTDVSNLIIGMVRRGELTRLFQVGSFEQHLQNQLPFQEGSEKSCKCPLRDVFHFFKSLNSMCMNEDIGVCLNEDGLTEDNVSEGGLNDDGFDEDGLNEGGSNEDELNDDLREKSEKGEELITSNVVEEKETVLETSAEGMLEDLNQSQELLRNNVMENKEEKVGQHKCNEDNVHSQTCSWNVEGDRETNDGK